MRIERKRSNHAHRHAERERDHGGAELKVDEVSELDQHDQEGEQHDVHHAPFAEMLHEPKREGLVVAIEDLEPTQFNQQNDLGERKDDGKKKHDGTHEIASVMEQFDRATQNALLVLLSQPLDPQNGQHDGRPEENEGGDGRRGRAARGKDRGSGREYRRLTAGAYGALAGIERGEAMNQSAAVAGLMNGRSHSLLRLGTLVSIP